MGTAISRIEKEFILTNLDEKKITVKVHGDRKEHEGVVLNINEPEWIEFFNEDRTWEGFEKNENIRVFFSYYGHVMTFISKVMEVGETLKVKYPEGIHKNLQRKYERVPPPKESSISFTVKETRVEMEFPRTEEFDPVEEPEIHGNLDTQDLNQLISIFREETQEQSDINKIIMFRGREPKILEERIIAATGKILYIESTRKGVPRGGVNEDSRIITEKYLFPTKKEDYILPELTAEQLRDYFKDRRSEGYDSIIYCPILYHQFAVGCIVLETRRNSKEPLDLETLEYVFQFSKILAYSLKLNGYFSKSHEVMADYNTGVVDISASGLLFANPSKDLSLALTLYSDLEIDLKLGERRMKIGTRIMRKYTGKKTIFYGVQYLDIKPEDFRFLFDYVYGKEFRKYDDNMWEGGAEPPTLSFD